MLKLYIHGIDLCIVPKRYYIFPNNIFNELHEWIDKHPCLIKSPNVLDFIFIKFNGDLLNKQKHLIQISVHEIHNDIILPVFQGGFHGGTNMYERVYIGDTYLIKYMPKHIKPMSNINRITCGYETCISAILFQYDLNKWWFTSLAKIDKFYINTV